MRVRCLYRRDDHGTAVHLFLFQWKVLADCRSGLQWDSVLGSAAVERQLEPEELLMMRKSESLFH